MKTKQDIKLKNFELYISICPKCEEQNKIKTMRYGIEFFDACVILEFTCKNCKTNYNDTYNFGATNEQ